ncbi:hypothetical protein CYMTET_12693 [Cymbomonas tetramitiformis]|uniref:Uncharacterized protein n=1 Tax=Cymbomonas tetramitiformis TaxID=36881 RepID=A0AAE0LC72_9CHLO|nr:hypothetical protein CYMTET_12693 [Cymbomonas tetramitiformis]
MSASSFHSLNMKEGAFLPTMGNMKGSRGGFKNAAGLHVAETRGQPTQGNQRRHFQSLKNASPPRTRSPPGLSTALAVGTNPRPWTAQSRGIREVSPSDSPITPGTFISQGVNSLGPSPSPLEMSIRPSPSPSMAS